MKSIDPTIPEPNTPHEEYSRRIALRREVQARHSRIEGVLGNSRFVFFFGCLLVLWLAFGPGWLPLWTSVVAVSLFLAFGVWHRRVSWACHRAGRAVAFYQSGIDRLEDRWSGTGETGSAYQHDNHPNAADLDLFGEGSLFQLLNTTRTRSGEAVLAGWLLEPADAGEIRSRQEAVKELRSRLDLREDLSLLGAGKQSGVDFQALSDWGKTPPTMTSKLLWLLLFPLALLNVAAILDYFVLGETILIMVPPFAVGGLLGGLLAARVNRVLSAVDKRAHDLALLSGVLARLEEESFHSERLRKLHALIVHAGQPPSKLITKLVNLIDTLNWYRNPYFAPIGAVLFWRSQFAFLIDRWRGKAGNSIAGWLHAVGEFEALSSLATYAYENPDDVFPTIVESAPCFSGESLGHPLLPRARCVRNSVSLADDVRLLVMSGSNMSGKSTMLRTIGINAVLALAGSVVRATKLTISPLRVGGTLRVQDSLQAGRSRFYAEITRIKQLVELTKTPLPLLFLLDEVLAGTNSHDRRLGAESTVRGLLNRKAIGIVTTHDLALTELVDRLAPHARNVHFADVFENGQIKFDYTMRPGVVQHSNALELMRAVGLEVEG